MEPVSYAEDLGVVRAQLDEKRVIEAVQGAIRTPSVFGSEAEVADYFADLMRNAGYTSVETQEVQEGRPNVIGEIDTGREGPRLVLQGHMDTVPVGEHPEPFSGEIRDGAIWGRGASDMKGPLATAVMAVELARKAYPDLAGRVAVIGTVDEESEKRGIFDVVDRGFEADFGICVEPTDLRVAIAQKGCVSARVTTRGVAAHGANPHMGVNAIAKMADVIKAIEGASLPTVDIPGVGEVSGTYNVGVISGGQMFFIVPDHCSIWVDRRTVPGETQDDALQVLAELVHSVDPDAEVVAARQDWNWERIQSRGIGSCSVPMDSAVVQAVLHGIETVSGAAPVLHVQNAWCETDFLVNDLGIPTVNFGPGKMELAHTSNEHIEIQSVIDGVQALAIAIGDVCRSC
jgi:acetylornithine deacetylase/succinyl-diaminopimelate desuccinylase family protein